MKKLLILLLVLLGSSTSADAVTVCATLDGDATTVKGAAPPFAGCTGGGTALTLPDARWTVWLATANAQAAGNAFLAAYLTQINLGLTLTSTGSSSLNGTYPVDSNTVSNILGLYFRARTIGTNYGPGGVSTVNLYDVSQQPHSFNSTQMINYGDAVAVYLASLAPQAVGPPGNHGWPANTATIP